MSLFPIPSRVVKTLDALKRNFLWQSNKIEKWFNLVKWVSEQQSRKHGGLGVRNLKLQNKSKSAYEMALEINQENQVLWREVIHHKYCQEDQWCTNKVTNTYEWGFGGPSGLSGWHMLVLKWAGVTRSCSGKRIGRTRGFAKSIPWDVLYMLKP